jgi:hypothetical protein
MQLQYITDDAALTDAGRRLMSQIGAYALPNCLRELGHPNS